MSVGSQRRLASLLADLPAASADAFAAYQRVLAQRVALATAWVALLVLPGLQVLEWWLQAPTSDLWLIHALVRLPLLLAALAILYANRRYPEAAWPRPTVLAFATTLVAAGWFLLWLHHTRGSDHLHLISHSLIIATVAVAVLATRGLRDLAIVYLLPTLIALLALWWARPLALEDVIDVIYPLVAMGVGAVIAELIYRGHVETFLATQQLAQSALTDALSGLLNRRAINRTLTEQHARAARHHTPYALLMADLDHFKRVNDTHGHDVGDQVLKELGARLRAAVRTEDQVARWGGEEFLVLLQDADEQDAMQVAEKIRAQVGETPFATSAGELSITVSLGVAVCRGEGSPEQTTNRADEALYEAKRGGRNRCVLATAPDPARAARHGP